MVQRRKRDIGDTDHEVSDKFMRAWLRNKATDNIHCHMRSICEANNVLRNSSVALVFADVATQGLIRELQVDQGDLHDQYEEAGVIGRHGENCGKIFNDCNGHEANSLNLFEKAWFFPTSNLT